MGETGGGSGWWADAYREPPAPRAPLRWGKAVAAVAVVLSVMLASIALVHAVTGVAANGLPRWHPGAPNPVPNENAKAGSHSWELSGPHDGGIEGFAAPITMKAGDRLSLYVSTIAPRYDVQIFRMGWYGGAGARHVYHAENLNGVKQRAPTVSKPLANMVETHWKPSITLDVPSAWTSGVYLARLRGSNGSQSYAPFVVRDDRPATFFYQASVTTWLAYNTWGGKGLYKDVEGPDAGDWNARSRMVSLDRPFDRKVNPNGAEEFLLFEYPMIRYLERNGFDVTYGTSIETHTRPDLIVNHSAFLSVGHDEYWSLQMRDNLERARDAGVNLAFFGANDGYRAIRFSSSPLGPYRRFEHYKEYTEDPLLGKNDDKVAAQWRFGPANRPENALIGEMYACDPVDAPWVVHDTSNWLFDGTGFKPGDSVPHLVGHEYDHVWRSGPFAASTPVTLEVVNSSPVLCGTKHDVSDTTFYTTRKGAGVFAAGTIRWSWGLDTWGPSARGSRKLERLTTNLLRAFSDGPYASRPVR